MPPSRPLAGSYSWSVPRQTPTRPCGPRSFEAPSSSCWASCCRFWPASSSPDAWSRPSSCCRKARRVSEPARSTSRSSSARATRSKASPSLSIRWRPTSRSPTRASSKRWKRGHGSWPMPTAASPRRSNSRRRRVRSCGSSRAPLRTSSRSSTRSPAKPGGCAARPTAWSAGTTVGSCIWPRMSTSSRSILDRAVVHVPDVLEDPDYDRSIAFGIQNRSTLAVPMLLSGEPIGTISVGRLEPHPFSQTQIALLQTFADQAVIAIENVRLFKELEARNRDLTESLEQQTATSEILRVISSSPTDVQPVFEAIAQSAMRLCDGTMSVVSRYDGELIHLGAYTHVSAEGVELIHRRFPMQPMRDTISGRGVLEGRVVHIPDVRADAEFNQAISQALQSRSSLGVPMLLDGKVVGAITVARPEVRPFSDAQIALLKTFADQAVIAIENVRLFKELQEKNRALTKAHAQVSEALEQQTATSEILQIISRSPTDLQPVLDTIVKSAARFCGAKDATIAQLEGAHL